MIQFLASPETMRRALKQIDFDNQWITHIEADRKELVFFVTGNDNKRFTVNIHIDHNYEKLLIQQTAPRWDWVKLLMSQVDSQPICFTISEQRINILFQY